MGAHMYDYEVGELLAAIREKFHTINQDTSLTEADKKQLKDFYLQNMIAPQARKLLEKHFPNEFNHNSGIRHRMTPADRRRRDAMRSASPDRTPDR